MVADWVPCFVLPNISIDSAIGCDVATLAPHDDPRVQAIQTANPNFACFMSRFSTAFGKRFEPSVILVKEKAAPELREISAIASFRDLIALSVIPLTRAEGIVCPCAHTLHPAAFGEAFAFYPWMLNIGVGKMVCSTPALCGFHKVDAFSGQSSPQIPRAELQESQIDKPLLQALLGRWEGHFAGERPDRKDVALFRSLNMGNCSRGWPGGGGVGTVTTALVWG